MSTVLYKIYYIHMFSWETLELVMWKLESKCSWKVFLRYFFHKKSTNNSMLAFRVACFSYKSDCHIRVLTCTKSPPPNIFVYKYAWLPLLFERFDYFDLHESSVGKLKNNWVNAFFYYLKCWAVHLPTVLNITLLIISTVLYSTLIN